MYKIYKMYKFTEIEMFFALIPLYIYPLITAKYMMP